MDFSVTSILAITKLFARDPAAAARLVLAMNVPLNGSILMIALAGAANGLLSGAFFAVFEQQMVAGALATGAVLPPEMVSPLLAGLGTMLDLFVFGYAAYWIGTRLNGKGSVAGMMSVYGTLQIAIIVLTVPAFAVMAISVPLVPVFASFIFISVMLFIVIVTLRGLGHTVKEVHELPSMWTAVGVIVGALLVTFLVSNFVKSLLSPLFSGAA